MISKNQFGCENGAGVRDSGNSWNFGRGTNQYSCCDCANGFICRNVSCAVPRPSRQKPAVIPKQAIILLSGVPATGKSEFARHLAREYGFAHYDLECHPRGWPHPELKATWDASRSGFVAQLRQYHERIVLDWGFPPSAVPWVEELRRSGAKLVWFDGDIARAQQVFVQRGGSRWNVLTDKSRPSTKQDTRHHFSASSCPLCPPPEPSWLSARLKG